MAVGDPNPDTKRGLPTVAKVAIGCGIAFALVVMLVCGGGFFALRWGMSKLDTFAREFEQQGYVRVGGQVIEITTPVTERTVFVGQVVRIRSKVQSDIALMSQVAEIYESVDGDIDFFGQVLKIQPAAVVHGNIRIKGAQVVQVLGKVEGEVTGNYTTLQGGPMPAAQPQGQPEPGSGAQESKPAPTDTRPEPETNP